MTKEQYLRQLCDEGIVLRYTPERLAKVQEKYPGQDPLEVVKKRLEYELDIIISKGMGDYHAYRLGFYRIGPKSAASRWVLGGDQGRDRSSYILIGITDIEPLRFHLFFERFINPERISYPDIDVDICMDRRAEVIDYTVAKIWQGQSRADHHFRHDESQDGDQRCGTGLSVPLPKVNDDCQAGSGRSQHDAGKGARNRSRSESSSMKQMTRSASCSIWPENWKGRSAIRASMRRE